MITITRSMARLVRAVFRKALGNAARGSLGVVGIESSADGLLFKSKFNDVAIEYRVPGHYPAESVAVPIDLLRTVEAGNDEPVQIQQSSKRMVEAHWNDGAVPQIGHFDADKAGDRLKGFPAVPREWLENEPRLLEALQDAAGTVNQYPNRFATNMIQFRNEMGSLGATDGRHLLVQRGFALPKGELLFPANNVFTAKELPTNLPVFIGRTEDWLSVRVGPWMFHFLIDKAGRYPKLQDQIRAAETATSKLHVSEPDAAFLAQTLERLPNHEHTFQPVTVELNSQVCVRAKPEESSQVTEVLLSSSSLEGTATAFNTDRRYLARALRMGFREILIFDKDRPVQCQDEHRTYVWMPLSSEGVIKRAKAMIQIHSPLQEARDKPQLKQQRTTSIMPRRKASDFGVVPANGTTNGSTSGHTNGNATEPSHGASHSTSNGAANGDNAPEVSLIDQAEAVRTSLREAVDKVGDLIGSLKKQRKQSRLVQSTLSSLRQLQTLDA
ncbi:MAG: hypothetical protein K8T91_04205 [Planctomycetes bacterium]|nr:hypothetical protein [Planctomycetota bacterium]